MAESTLSFAHQLALKSNRLVKKFNSRLYSKVPNADHLLLKKEISVEVKKRLLISLLHDSLVSAFSFDRKRFSSEDFKTLRVRIHSIRKIIDKLRSINYYLETAFVHDLRRAGITITSESRVRKIDRFVKDELEALEYTAYKLIEEALVLDKKILNEYSKKEKFILQKEKIELKDLALVLSKETQLLEHLEAKLPPPKALSAKLLKDPIFSHWVSRIFSLLCFLGLVCSREELLFKKLKKNHVANERIGRKISHLIREKSQLISVLHEKSGAMQNSDFKKELHNFSSTISL